MKSTAGSYLAILGRQPQLSLAELESILGAEAVQPIGHHAILAEPPKLEHLGGTIKLARIIATAKGMDEALLAEVVALLPQANTKLTLGLSYYGRGEILRLGMQIKKLLRSGGRSVRLVLPKSGSASLSAAQLKYNQLATAESPELIILEQSNRVVVALTANYQDIDAYSARDYDRPKRNARVGMLPPKLAQILINLAGVKTGSIYDPFCGSGVILQEARLMGLEAHGSDIAPAMVEATRANMEWLDQQRPGLPAWSVTLCDARKLKLPAKIGGVVSEGDLGPAYSSAPTKAQVTKAGQDISDLVRSFLLNLAAQLPPQTPVVLCLPQWQAGGQTILPPVIDEIYRLGYTVEQFARVDSRELVYHRPGQIVARKILVMKRK